MYTTHHFPHPGFVGDGKMAKVGGREREWMETFGNTRGDPHTLHRVYSSWLSEQRIYPSQEQTAIPVEGCHGNISEMEI